MVRPGQIIGPSLAPPGAGLAIVTEDADVASEFQDGSADTRKSKTSPWWLGKAVVAWASRILERRQAVSSLLAAIRAGNTIEVLDALTSSADVLAEFRSAYDGNTVWHLLAEFGDASQLQTLINFIRIHYHTPVLQRLAYQKSGHAMDSTDLIIALINRGNNLQQTPLMFAAYHGRDESVKLLLQQGADPWVQDRCGQRTALHYACRKGHVGCVRMLLDYLPAHLHTNPHGTKFVDVRTASGFTPLHFAVAVDSVQCVRLLVAYGAGIHYFNLFSADDFWVSCPHSTTPLHLAALLGLYNVAMALLRTWWDELRGRGGVCAHDPRRYLDGNQNTPFQVALRAGHEELAEKLHPTGDIESQWSPADLAKFASTGNVPSLQVLVARVLEERLTTSIQEAVDCMKLLGTYQQAGRVFNRQGRYTPFPAGVDSQFLRDSTAGMYEHATPHQPSQHTPPPPPPGLYMHSPGPRATGAAYSASGEGWPVPGDGGGGRTGSTQRTPTVVSLAASRQASQANSRPVSQPAVVAAPLPPPAGPHRSTDNGGDAKLAVGALTASGPGQLPSSAPLHVANGEGDAVRPAGDPPPEHSHPSSQESSLPALGGVKGGGASQGTADSVQGHSPRGPGQGTGTGRMQGTSAAPAQACASGFARFSSRDSSTHPGLSTSGSCGHLAGVNSGQGEDGRKMGEGAGGGSQGLHRGSSMVGFGQASSQPEGGSAMTPSDATTAHVRVVGAGDHAHAIIMYPLQPSPSTTPNSPALTRAPTGNGDAGAYVGLRHQLALHHPPQYGIALMSVPGAIAADIVRLPSGLPGGAPGLGPRGAGQNGLGTTSVDVAGATGMYAGLPAVVTFPRAMTAPSLAASSVRHATLRATPRGGSSAVTSTGASGALDVVKAWIGYDRMYDAQRGARLGRQGEEASSLRQYETAWEVKRRRSRRQSELPRTTLCGVLPLPNCLFDPHNDSASGLRPGYDVCGMCMDNKPLLEMRHCRHRICIMCAKTRVQALELRQLVTCPFCAALVYDFILA